MRILVYGFGPYRRFPDNVTEKIVRALPRRRGLKKVVFPVRFHKDQFTDAVKEFRPVLIVGLGQCSRGRLLRCETTAINRQRSGPDKRAKPIVRAGAPRLSANLRLDLATQGRASKYAGDYVCNYSMYVISDFIRRRKLPIRFCFVHVPRGYDVKKAARIFSRLTSVKLERELAHFVLPKPGRFSARRNGPVAL